MNISLKHIKNVLQTHSIGNGDNVLRELAHVTGIPDALGLVRLYFALLYLNGDENAGKVLSAMIWYNDLDKPVGQ